MSFIAGDPTAALDQLLRAIELSAGLDSLAEIHGHLGLFFVGLDDPDGDPMHHLDDAIRAIEADGHRRSTEFFRAFCYARQDQLDLLAVALDDAVRTSEEYNYANALADVALAVAEALERAGDGDAAGELTAALYRQTYTMPYVYQRYRRLRARVPAHDRPEHRLPPRELYRAARERLERLEPTAGSEPDTVEPLPDQAAIGGADDPSQRSSSARLEGEPSGRLTDDDQV